MIPWWRFSRAPRGTVYLVQSELKHALYKVGFTTRRTIDRRAELNRHAAQPMRIVATVSMPWARQCEASVLRGLRRNPFRLRHPLGSEWFVLGRFETIQSIADRIERVSRQIELIAKAKLSWPKGAARNVFRSAYGARRGVEEVQS